MIRKNKGMKIRETNHLFTIRFNTYRTRGYMWLHIVYRVYNQLCARKRLDYGPKYFIFILLLHKGQRLENALVTLFANVFNLFCPMFLDKLISSCFCTIFFVVCL